MEDSGSDIHEVHWNGHTLYFRDYELERFNSMSREEKRKIVQLNIKAKKKGKVYYDNGKPKMKS